MPQNKQRETLGEGGSIAGGTCRVRKAWLPDLLRSTLSLHLRCTFILDPTLRECLSSLDSKLPASASPVALWSLWFWSSDISLPSQTKPDEPDLLNVWEDLWSPPISISPFYGFLSLCVCVGGGGGAFCEMHYVPSDGWCDGELDPSLSRPHFRRPVRDVTTYYPLSSRPYTNTHTLTPRHAQMSLSNGS